MMIARWWRKFRNSRQNEIAGYLKDCGFSLEVAQTIAVINMAFEGLEKHGVITPEDVEELGRMFEVMLIKKNISHWRDNAR
jgi:hypothetical protein